MNEYLKKLFYLFLPAAFIIFPFFANAANWATNLIPIITTGTTTWAVPGDWDNNNNSVEVIGGGGGGANAANGSGAAGGGGGAYASSTNVSLTAGGSTTVFVGAGGASAATGGPGNFTLFRVNGTTEGCLSAFVCAAPGDGGASGTGLTATTTGGTTARSFGQTTYAGGNGGPGQGTSDSSGGGGGAGGPAGPGRAGGPGGPLVNGTAGEGGGGGGGAGGGQSTGVEPVGSNGYSTGINGSATGGNGGKGPTGTAGGTGGNAALGTKGTNGSGGGGSDASIAGTTGGGGNGGEWATSTPFGAGGGGGGTGNNNTSSVGGIGGSYGAGGGGSEGTGGVGAQGIIVIQYNSAFSVSGTLYNDDGLNADTTGGLTVKLAVATGTTPGLYATTTRTNGVFEFRFPYSGFTSATGAPMILWLSGQASKAVSITKASSTNVMSMITNFNLYKNRVIVRHEGTSATSTTIADLAVYDHDNNSDIPYIANGGTLDILAGNEFHIAAGSEFAPGGAVTIEGNGPSGIFPDGNLHLETGHELATTVATSSILTMGSNALALAGSIFASSTSILSNGGTITFNATTTGKQIFATSSPVSSLGIVTFNGSGGGWTFGDNASTTNFTILSGAVTAPSGLLSISGSYSASSTFTHNSGTILFDDAAKAQTIQAATGTWAFNNVQFLGTGAKVFAGNASTTNFTLTAGSVTAPSLLSVSGNFSNAATFTHNSGTVYFTGATKTLSSNNAVFNNIDVSGSYSMQSTGVSSNGNATISGTLYPQNFDLRMINSGKTLTGGGSVGSLLIETNSGITLSGADLTVGTTTINSGGTLTIGSGRVLTSTSTLTVNGTGTLNGAGTTTIQHSNLTNGGTLSSNVQFDATNGNITMPARTYGANIEILGGANTLTAAGNATSTKAFIISSGTFTAPGSTASLYIGKAYTNNGTFTHNSGIVFFNGTGAQAISGATSSSAFNNIDFSGAGAKTFSGNASTTNFTIRNGAGAVTAPTLLSIAGNYSNLGTFTAGNGTTTFSGTSAQTISGVATGTSAFYNIEILNSSASTTFAVAASTTKNFYVVTPNAKVEFAAGATSSMTNLIINGQAANTAINLFSGTPGTWWNLYATGTRTVQYARIQDSSACSEFGAIDVTGGTNTNVGNNNCWTFVVATVAATATSSANQTFEISQVATAMSKLTIIAGAGTGAITAADATGDLRIAIATSTVNMLWDTTKTDAIFGGTASSSAKIAACGCVSYEGGGSVAKIDVITNFTSGDVLTVSGLRFTSFGAVVASSTALQLFLDGANDISANAQDTMRYVAIYGKLALADHASGQKTNKFDTGSATISNSEVFQFKFTTTGENSSTSPVIALSNVGGLVSANITNANLYVDANSNGSVDGGDYTVGGAGAVAVSGNTGTITFGTPFATSTHNYILRADFTSVNSGNSITFGLTTANITASGTISQITITPTGSVASVTHFRPAGGGTTPTGGAAPADVPTYGGTTPSGGAPVGGAPPPDNPPPAPGTGQGGGAGGGIDLEPLLLKAFANALEGFRNFINIFKK